jgi:hypothetical protein
MADDIVAIFTGFLTRKLDVERPRPQPVQP